MAISLASVAKTTALRAPRIVLLGTAKVGKSTFASESDSPIFIPVMGEEGIDGLGIDAFPTTRTFGEVCECLASLANEEHEYKTVVIDSVSTLEKLAWDDACARNGGVSSIEKIGGGFGKGYTEVLTQWNELTRWLDYLRDAKGIASVLIGHVKVKAFNDPTADSYDTYLWDIHEKASNMLDRWADAILFAHRATIVKKEDAGFNKERSRGIGDDRRVLYTQKRPAHPGGGRGAFGRVPYELPLSWAAWKAAVAEVARTKASD